MCPVTHTSPGQALPALRIRTSLMMLRAASLVVPDQAGGPGCSQTCTCPHLACEHVTCILTCAGILQRSGKVSYNGKAFNQFNVARTAPATCTRATTTSRR